VQRAFAALAGDDHSAAALRAGGDGTETGGDEAGQQARSDRPGAPRGSQRPLKLPSAVLPGQQPAPGEQQQAAGGQEPGRETQEGLLDYLLGGGA
jgi:hypothetical protein